MLSINVYSGYRYATFNLCDPSPQVNEPPENEPVEEETTDVIPNDS